MSLKCEIQNKTPRNYLKIARDRERIVKYLLRRFASCPDKDRLQIIRQLVRRRTTRGQRLSRSTVYSWIHFYERDGFKGLIPHYKNYDGIPRISDSEREILIDIFQKNVTTRIGTAILIAKYSLGKTGSPSPSSPATLRRWAKRFLQEREN